MIADDSGVKHFDRKFVASNLQNLLRCPKCSKCYTYSYNKNEGDGKINSLMINEGNHELYIGFTVFKHLRLLGRNFLYIVCLWMKRLWTVLPAWNLDKSVQEKSNENQRIKCLVLIGTK